jgi:CRISPR system Cascade subunit CasB
MSDQPFVDHLQRLSQSNRGALAELRRSLTFAPGTAPRVFPYVEPFIAADEHPDSARRQSHYLVAGLFALHPKHSEMTLAKAMGVLYRKQEQSPSIDGQLMGPEQSHAVAQWLGQGLADWLNPTRPEALDKLRRRWASDFYRVAATADSND